MNSCYLEKLKQVSKHPKDNERPGNVFEGLILKDGQLKIDSSYFKCCDGSGTFLVSNHQREMGIGDVIKCKMRYRYKMLSDIYAVFQSLYPRGKLANLSGDQIQFLTTWAKGFATGKTVGQAIATQEEAASNMWPISLFLLWHMGLKPKVVYLEKQFESAIFDGIEDTDFVVVGGLSKLWDAGEQLKLDRLINYCYGGEIPMWIFFPAKQKNYAPPGRRIRFFEKKLIALKSKNPLSHLSVSTYDKLSEICMGLERIPR